MGTSTTVREPVTLLRTKLHRPQVGPELVRRPRLESRLDQGLNGMLILVSAPAGFGKTTLVSQWLEIRGYRAAWLSLHERDGDLEAFLRYVIATIRTVYADACPSTWALLDAPQLPPVDYLATSLVGELDEVPEDLLLVLDDYSRAQSQSVNQLIETLVELMPRSMRLVLITRADPSLPLANLRAGRRMLELRANDLRFTSDEVRAFFRQSIGVDVDPESLTILEQRTEGWIVGLQLAGLSLRDAGELAALMKSIEGTDRHVMDYLLAEVLSRQPKVTQEVLLRSSILGRFCAPLLDVLLDCEKPAGGYQETLQQMEQANLFLVPLDHERAWYRYHHLFRELLQHRLRSESGAELVASLHARASAWFANEGLIEEALTHALTAGDPLSAARLVEQHRHALLNREDWRTLVDWLEILPQELVQQRPALLLVGAWRQQWLWQYATMPSILQKAEELIAQDAGDLTEPEKQLMRGEIDLLQSALWFARGDGRRCVECAQRALERIPRSLVYARGLLFEYLGFGYQISGQAETGIRILEEAFASDDAKEDLFAARVLLGLGVIHHLSGHLQLQEQVAQQILGPMTGKGLSLSAPWAYWLLGTARYQQNSLAEAAPLFSAVTEHRYLANARASHECLLNLALTYQAQGRPKAASEVVETALQFALETRHPIHLLEARSFQARLALLQGDLEAALRWARGVKPEDLPARLPWTEVPRLTLAKVLIAEGMRDSLRQASQILEEVLGVAQDMHAGRLIIEVLALQALACDAQGEVQKALDLIRQALDLAQPDGFIRVFVDFGPTMARLLYRVAELEKEPDRVGQLTVAFSPSSPAGRAAQRSDQIAQPQTVEPLTNREREILELLARRLSDKEIARVLTISPHTVSKHVGNLCAKLQVAGRRQAVSKARVLGILSPQ